jgi:hypothetical protein
MDEVRDSRRDVKSEGEGCMKRRGTEEEKRGLFIFIY